MEESKVKAYVEKLSKLFQKTPSDVDQMYKTELKNTLSAYEMPEDQAREFALNRTFSMLKAHQLDATETFDVVLTGTDGRIMNWATYARRKIGDQIKKLKAEKNLSDQELVSLGLVDSEGNFLYPKDDKYRGGKPIPQEDMSVTFEGVVKHNGKYVKGNFSSRDPRVLEMVGKKKAYKVVAFRNKNKSTDTELALTVKDCDAFTPVADLKWGDYVKACELLYGKYTGGFDRLVKISEEQPQDMEQRKLLVKDVEVMSVRTGIGSNQTTVAVVQIPGGVENIMHDKFSTMSSINLWIPKEIGFMPKQHQKISFFGNISKPDTERGMAVMNAVSVWCDEKELKADPELPKEKPKEEETEFKGW